MKRTNWREYNYHDSLINKLFLLIVGQGYRKLLSSVKLPVNPRIIELGSGTGFNSLMLAKFLNSSRVTLVDSCDDAIKSSKLLFKGFKADFVKGSVFKLNLKGNFDLVHSQGLIEHFQGGEFNKLIKVHSNLARKGGFVVIFYPVRKGLYSINRWVLERLGKWIFHDEIPLNKELVINAASSFNLKFIKSVIVFRAGLTEEGLLFRKY